MGWLFKYGYTRKNMIADRITPWENAPPDGMIVKSTCIAHCYRGGVFSGILWTVWERTFSKDEQQVESAQRWIACDLLRYQRDYGWGYKDMDECMHPYFYSCPLSYLDLVPIDQFGGNAEWRELVRNYHKQQTEKRRARKAAKCI